MSAEAEKQPPCLPDDALADFVDGRLDGEPLARAEAHVAECTRCRELVAALLDDGEDRAVPTDRRISRYVVIEPLGAGAMGVVYAAYDPELDRKVAVKLLRADRATSAERTRARLLREAKAMAQISHPNVVQVHDAGTFQERVFVAMELVPGETLRAWTSRAARPWREVLDVFAQCARGLAAAHAAGLVHRDFKPDNVLVTADGRAKVTDFGLARAEVEEDDAPAAGGDAHLFRSATRTGALRGTPAYMAPEQLAGETADARSDQFGFGVALFEALAGARPFEGKTVGELRGAIAAGPADAARALRDVPNAVRRAVERTLRVAPGERFASMDEVAALLERPKSRRPTLLALGAATCAVGLALAAGRATSAAPAPCAGVADKGASVWQGGARDKVRAAFSATGAPFAADTFRSVDAALSAYMKGWAEERVLACEATRLRAEQSEELFDLRMRCLDGALEGAASLAAALTTADRAAVGSAAQAVVALPPLATCEDVAALRARVKPPSGAARAKIDEQVRALAAARASSELGRYEEARAKATGVVAASRALGYPPLAGEALFLEGQVLERLSRYKESGERLREAAWTSMAAKDDDTTFAATAALVTLVKYRLALPDEGQLWDRTAGALLDARGQRPMDEATLEESRGAVDRAQGRYADAVAHTQRALTLERGALGDGHLAVAATLASLAYSLARLGRYEEARAALVEVIATRERTLGREHPLVAQAESLFGMVLVYLAQLDEAIPPLQHALAVLETNLGPDHIETGYTLNRIGNVYFARGDVALAHAVHARVLALGIKVLGPDHPEVGLAHMNLSQSLRELGRLAETEHELDLAQRILEGALGKNYSYLATVKAERGGLRLQQGKPAAAEALHREAIALAEASLGKAHPETVTPRRMLAEDVLAEGRADEAVRLLDDTLADCDAAKMAYPDAPATKFALARALAATKKDPARARRFAEEARAGYRYDSQRDRDERARIDAWLAAAP